MTRATISFYTNKKKEELISKLYIGSDGGLNSLGSHIYNLFKNTKLDNKLKINKDDRSTFSGIEELNTFLVGFFFNDKILSATLLNPKTKLDVDYEYFIYEKKGNFYIEIIDNKNNKKIASKISNLNKYNEIVDMGDKNIIDMQKEANDFMATIQNEILGLKK